MIENQETNVGGDALSDAEQAYFQTGGEAEITDAGAPPEQVQEPDAGAQQADNADPEQEDDAGNESEDGSEPRKSRYVRHGAFHAEREEHKKTKAQLEEITRKQAILEDRWNTLLKAGQPQQTEQPADDTPPDPNEDVFAALKWTQDQLLASRKAEQERTQAEQARQQQTQQEQAVWSAWEQDARSYVAENADFPNAAKWLSDFRDKQLSALSKVQTQFADPAVRNAQIEQELKQIVIAAKQQNMSSAQFIYEIAQGYGYTPTTPEPDANKQHQLPDSLAKVAQAMGASKTIASNPGKGSNDPTSPEAIASMSDKEFSAWIENPENARRFQRMMGAG